MKELFSTPEVWLAMLAPVLVLAITSILVFNTKKDNTKNTTPIFNILLHSSLAEIVLLFVSMTLLLYVKGCPLFVSQILMRLFLICNDLYVTYIGIYLATIIHLDSVRNKNIYDKTVRLHYIIFIIIAIIQLALPVNLENCEMSGLGPIVSSLFFASYLPYWLYLIIKYRKEANFTIGLQAVLFIICGVAAILFGIIIPESHMAPILAYAIIFILYLRNENPDLKYLDELSKTKEETEKALEAKNDFLNSMSEELREPLNNIINSANTIYTYKDNANSEIKDDIDFILPTSKNLYEIVGNIIDINKIENNQVKIYEAPYNPTNMIESVINDEKTRINDSKVEIVFECDESIPNELIGDEKHVKQILRNLISNAVKYTKEGKVTVKAIAEKTSYDTYNLKVKVIDTGIGIKNETLINLFTNFSKSTEQNNSNIAGTGLGLAITKKLIDLLDGTITVESIYGSGSTFTVTIPHKIQ